MGNENRTNNRVKAIRERRKRVIRKKRLLGFLAVVCALATAYGLIFTGLTLDKQTYCGKEEHSNSDEFLESKLVCKEEEVHKHSDECFKISKVLVCEDETEEHKHEDACYEEKKETVCKLEEGAKVHTHTDKCYEKTSACDKEEHRHTLECYSDTKADVETKADWEQSISKVKLTGVWADDVVAIAKSQVGYKESEKNYKVAEGDVKKGYTRYGEWFRKPYEDWNGIFASFCLSYAKVSVKPYKTDISQWISALKQDGQYANAGEYVPVKGDLVFVDNDGDKKADTVGIVTNDAQENGKLQVIEGDKDGAVKTTSYGVKDSKVVGYGKLPIKEEEKAEETKETTTETTTEKTEETGDGDEKTTTDDEDAKKQAQAAVANVVKLRAPMKAPQKAPTKATNIAEGVDGNITWYITSDGVLHLEGTGNMKDYRDKYVSPNYITTAPWGEYSDKITSLVIHTGITSIGQYAFYHCENISSVDIPDSVTSIGDGAFYRCDSLQSVKIPASVRYIKKHAFYYCTGLTNVEISEGVTSIGDGAFSNCTGLTSVEIPAGVAYMGYNVFSSCESLTSVKISEGVTSIGEGAFYRCDSLQSVKIPASVGYIKKDAFFYCQSLTNVEISEGITSIGDGAFYRCDSLQSVKIPASVTSIGKGAFSYCRGLTSVKIPEGVTTIGNSAFYRCDSLQSVEIPDSVTSIGEDAFSYCRGLTSVKIPEGVTTIGNSAFSSCTGLTSVKIPEGVTTIGNSTFSSCTGLTSVEIPENVQSIGSYVFSGTALDELKLIGNFNSIEGSFINGADISKIYWDIPGNETTGVFTGTPYRVAGDGFVLTVGKNVDVINGKDFEALYKMGMVDIVFEGPNYFTLQDLKGTKLPMPVSSLKAGQYFADGKGTLYRIENGEAELAYVPKTTTEFTVPANIFAENGDEIPVTKIGGFAFTRADELNEVTVENPGNITLMASAFQGAESLSAVNGKTTEQEATALFKEVGVNAFDETLIKPNTVYQEGDIKINDADLKVTVAFDPTTQHPAGVDANHVAHRYTGETLGTRIDISNPNIQKDKVIRVYFSFDSTGHQFDNYTTGTVFPVVSTTGENTTELTLNETNVPGIYYVEIGAPRTGDTVSIIVNNSYPSPTSGGGGMSVWADVLTGQEATQIGNGVIPQTNGVKKAVWETKPDRFEVKKQIGTSSSYYPKLISTPEGKATLNTLYYKISSTRQGDTLENIGRDNIVYVERVDKFTLPANIKPAPHILEAIENKSWINYSGDIRVGNSRIIEMYCSNIIPGSIDLSYDETGNTFIMRWKFSNNSMSSSIYFYSGMFVADEGSVTEGETYTLKNSVEETLHYTYSSDYVTDSEDISTFTVGKPYLTVKKNYVGDNNISMGHSQNWTLKVVNESPLPYTELTEITDMPENKLYLSPAQISKIFTEAEKYNTWENVGQYGLPVTITIDKATICKNPAKRTVVGTDGQTGTVKVADTGVDVPYNGMESNDGSAITYEGVITITRNTDGTLRMALSNVDNPKAVDVANNPITIYATLEEWGFLITADTKYTIKWSLPENFVMKPGMKFEETLETTAKDSFMLLTSDKRYSYFYGTGKSNIVSNNELIATKGGNSKAYNYFSEDFAINKGAEANGQPITAETKLLEGTVITYSPSITKKARNSLYDALPFTDHIEGAQALLVPVENNEGKSWTDKVETTTVDGVEYYILDYVDGSGSFEYREVFVGGRIADRVKVSKNASGRSTLIHWYFTEFRKSVATTYILPYKVLVCPNRVTDGTSTTYWMNNQCWLNDHQSHRLYASTGLIDQTAIDFDKRIVKAVGDREEGVTESNIKEGEKVYYRLQLRTHSGAEELSVKGGNLKDRLPKTPNSFVWSKDNVHIDSNSYQKGDDNSEINVNGQDDWSVTAPDGDGNQYIVWGNGFSATFKGKMNIFVQLDYPTGSVWEEYCKEYGTQVISNTLFVDGKPSTVNHNLSIEAKIRAQKGVDKQMFWGDRYEVHKGSDSRIYYVNNNNGNSRYVNYYVAIVNDGDSRLYLKNLYDVLPKGFTYRGMAYYGSSLGMKDYENRSSRITEAGDEYKFKAFYVVGSGKNGKVTFTIDKYDGTGSSSISPISYDEEKGMCYLNPGEYIDFRYWVNIDSYDKTDDIAINSVAMPYYDYNGGGFSISDKAFTVVDDNTTKDWLDNDGECQKITGAQATEKGFENDGKNDMWVMSDVAMTRGSIQPGITKKLESVTNIHGEKLYEVTAARPSDTLNWFVTMYNNGKGTFEDYVLTDVFDSAYMFTGTLKIKVYAVSNNYTRDLTYNISFTGDSKENVEVTIDGKPLKVGEKTKVYDYNGEVVNVGLWYTAEGKVALSVYVDGNSWAVAPGGKVEMRLSTKKMNDTLNNEVLYNNAYITPTKQDWNHEVTQGNFVYFKPDDFMGVEKNASVRNSAPITITYGYSTESKKYVEEVGNPKNKANEGSMPNYILLPDKDKEVRYTLEVINSTAPFAMENLVFIDGLPEIGDHAAFDKTETRLSEFKMGFANNPNVAVVVETKNGTRTTLDPSQFTVEYSTANEFEKEDWTCTETDPNRWTNTVTGESRSIRVRISDPAPANITDGEAENGIMPKGCKVFVSFNGVIDDANAAAGQIAWNSFGYKYKLKRTVAELESAPMNVGVMMSSIPKIRKKLINKDGSVFAAEQDEKFRFVAYKGAKLQLTDGFREEDLGNALKTAGYPYTVFELTVPKGADKSEEIKLEDLPYYEYQAGTGFTVKAGNDVFKWEKGTQYHIVELPRGEKDEYAYANTNGDKDRTFSFYHSPEAQLHIEATNMRKRFDLTLQKKDRETGEQMLSGAVFGLYSPDARDKISDEEYNKWKPTVTPEKEKRFAGSDGNEKTWYLHRIAETDKGVLSWTGLFRSEYGLVEVKAPDGYMLEDTPRLITQGETYEDKTENITNALLYNLPKTGGKGLLKYTIGGLLLICGAFILLYYRKPQRKKGGQHWN